MGDNMAAESDISDYFQKHQSKEWYHQFRAILYICINI